MFRENDNRYKATNVKFVRDLNASNNRNSEVGRVTFGAVFIVIFV